MKAILFAVLFAFFAMPASAEFVNGNKLKEWADADDRSNLPNPSITDFGLSMKFYGYVTGAFDANSNNLKCIPQNFTGGQLIAIVKKFIYEHPEHWNFSGDFIVLVALRKAYPCK